MNYSESLHTAKDQAMTKEFDQVTFDYDGKSYQGVVVAVSDFYCDVMVMGTDAEVWQVETSAVTVVAEEA